MGRVGELHGYITSSKEDMQLSYDAINMGRLCLKIKVKVSLSHELCISDTSKDI